MLLVRFGKFLYREVVYSGFVVLSGNSLFCWILQIMDPYLASYGVENPIYAVLQLAQTTMRSELGKITLDKTFEERDALNEKIVVWILIPILYSLFNFPYHTFGVGKKLICIRFCTLLINSLSILFLYYHPCNIFESYEETIQIGILLEIWFVLHRFHWQESECHCIRWSLGGSMLYQIMM